MTTAYKMHLHPKPNVNSLAFSKKAKTRRAGHFGTTGKRYDDIHRTIDDRAITMLPAEHKSKDLRRFY